MLHLCNSADFKDKDVQMNSKTKEQLIDVAIDLFAKRPNATMVELAKTAGVTRMTINRLFGTREELTKEIAFHCIAVTDQACTDAIESVEKAIDKLRAIILALVPYADKYHFLWHHSNVWEEESVASEFARHSKDLSMLIDEAKDDGDIVASIPNAWIIAVLDSTLYAAIRASSAGDIAVNDAAMLVERTLFDGIRGNRNT